MIPSSPSDAPVLGERVGDRAHVVWPSAHSTLQNDNDLLAVVVARLGHFLPGGGGECGETPEFTVSREILGECGFRGPYGPEVRLGLQSIHDAGEQTCFEKQSGFPGASVAVIGQAAVDAERRLAHAGAVKCMEHASHARVLRAAVTTSVAHDRDPR